MVKFAILPRVRELLMRRVFYSVLLAAVALGLLAGMSLWLAFASRAYEKVALQSAEESPVPEAGLKMVLTHLVARDSSSATSSSEIRAATAELLEGLKGFHVRQVEVDFTGSTGKGAGGFLSDATGPVFFRADEGWIDSTEGNLLLAGNIYGRRPSDGMELKAQRLEYEAAVDEIRLFSVRLSRAEFQKTDPFLVTDSQLKRLRSGTVDSERNQHPFFRLYGGGKVNEEQF